MALIAAIPAAVPRAALVTGGARRIGRAIALALADAGFSVAVHYHGSAAEAEQTAGEIRGRGVAAAVLAADLADGPRSNAWCRPPPPRWGRSACS